MTREIERARWGKASELRTILRAELFRARNPEKAGPMQAYMKPAMPYFGIQTPELRAIRTRVFAAHPIETPGAWRGACLRIWREAQFREERYAAIGLTGFRVYRSFQPLETVAGNGPAEKGKLPMRVEFAAGFVYNPQSGI